MATAPSISYLCAEEIDRNVIRVAQEGISAANSTGKPPSGDCPPQITEEIDRTITKSSVQGISGDNIDISMVSEDFAKELFDEMASQPHIPFAYPEDGCYARAHEMSRLLEEKGIITGKVFIEGSLRVETPNSPKGYVEWWYHVAPIIKVKKGEKEEVYVIDPSIFSEPVPAEEWFKIQTSHDGGLRGRTYQTRRFNYTPSDKSRDMQSYDQDDIDGMRDTMERYLRIQQERQQGK